MKIHLKFLKISSQVNFMFFKKTDIKEENNFIVKVCALLIHAAKIDENYTDKEEEIIKKTLNNKFSFC